MEDLKSMRKKAAAETKLKAKKVVENHPWFNELVTKVVVLNGAKRDVTPQETIILEELRRYAANILFFIPLVFSYMYRIIEDQSKFTKQVLYNLVRLLTTKEFLKDDIQRIIRFVKQHEAVTERDYIEAVEMAGHALF